eukprot:461466-Pelagomonas_calceolata.AAC.1
MDKGFRPTAALDKDTLTTYTHNIPQLSLILSPRSDGKLPYKVKIFKDVCKTRHNAAFQQ